MSDCLKIRQANLNDLDITFLWANNNEIRKYSFNRKMILKEEHILWFKTKIASEDCNYYILEDNQKPVGSIRFDQRNENTSEISFLVAPNNSNRGLGTFLIEKGVERFEKERPDIYSVFGIVLKVNIASKKIFKKLSYIELERDEVSLIYKKDINENR